MFDPGDYVCWRNPAGVHYGTVDGDEPPHVSVHGTLYGITTLAGIRTVAEEDEMQPVSAIELLANLLAKPAQ